MNKYLVFIWDPKDLPSGTRVTSVLTALSNAASPWESAYSDKGVLVMRQAGLAQLYRTYPLADQQGIILGSLFRRSVTEDAIPAHISISASESHSVVRSKGRYLLDNYWGSYVAVLRDRHSGLCTVLRDPTCNMSCYRVNWQRITVFFSDVEDIVRYIPIELPVNWPHITARLMMGFHYSRETSLGGMEDVVGGESLTVVGEMPQRATLWEPARFCDECGVEGEQAAAREMRSTVAQVIQTLAAQHQSIMLRLSGGLDSSIVAGCLAKRSGGLQVTCLNFFIGTNYGDESKSPLGPGLPSEDRAKLRRIIGSADERVFARLVAARCGFAIVEREKRASDLRLERVERAPVVPRPSHFAFLTFEDDVKREIADKTGATACFGGDAGDTVFFNTQRAIGAVDFAHRHPLKFELFRQIRTAALLSRESYARVLGKVVKHGLFGLSLPNAYNLTDRPHLLRNEAASNVDSAYFIHPWTSNSSSLSPGKREHVMGITNYIATYPHLLHSDRLAPCVHPLASQPVVETCLRIPTYVLLAGGVSRGLARMAFRDFIPPEVAKRTVKGGAMAFVQDVVRHNLDYVKSRLLDGILVRQGILDPRKLQAFLVEDQAFLTVTAPQIIDYLACEAWLGQVAAVSHANRIDNAAA